MLSAVSSPLTRSIKFRAVTVDSFRKDQESVPNLTVGYEASRLSGLNGRVSRVRRVGFVTAFVAEDGWQRTALMI